VTLLIIHVQHTQHATVGEQDGADLLERILTLKGYRAAMQQPRQTDDPFVNEFLKSRS